MNVHKNSAGFTDLSPLLRPRSIVVIGASDQPGNLGGIAIGLMQKFGYAGAIFPVNPKRASVHGLSCLPSVADLPFAPDLAIIATGAELAIDIVRQCAHAGIRYGVIWAGGYSEIGPEGQALQRRLLQACQETGFTVLGPNCIGVINARHAMVASFASFLLENDTLIAGDIAMISQSGGLATMAQAMAHNKGIGFGLCVSAGNEVMLSVADYIFAAANDPQIKVIATYIEGIRDGARFAEAVAAAQAAGKPVVVLKGGRSTASAQAVAAHTGALAGEHRVWSAIAAELGIISVGSLEELLDVSLYLSRSDLDRMPVGRRLAIVTFGGGSGVLSADQCADNGLELAEMSEATLARLAEIAPPIAAIKNPIDLTPQTFNQDKWFALFPEVLDVIAADPGVDIVFCQFGPMARNGPAAAKIIADLRFRTQKAVLIAWPLAPRGVYGTLDGEGVYTFLEYERAIAAISRIAHVTASRPIVPAKLAAGSMLDWDRHVPVASPGTVISEDACHAVLREMGVKTARGETATTVQDALLAAKRVGYPLAAKGISGAITHRAAAGLLALGIASDDELAGAFDRLMARGRELGVELEGVYLQEMISQGMEVIVSGFRDPTFGPMISVGSGGVLTELLDDVVLSRTPLDRESTERLLAPLRIVEAAHKLEPDARLADLVDFVAHFSTVVHSMPWENYVAEINPVKWNARGATAIDGLLIIEKALAAPNFFP